MAFAQAGDLQVHHALIGKAGAPVLVFSNSLGTDLSMWEAQAAALASEFRVLRYDTRGHGRTTVTRGPYTLEQLGGDVLCLLEALKLERVHFCGLSLGGQTGMWLGAHAANRIAKLALCNTAAQIGTAEMWNARIKKARAAGGMKAIAQGVVERWFTPGFRARSPHAVASAQRMIANTPPEGYAGCCAAVRDADLRDAVATIRAPTLIITGAHDPATPPEGGRFIADRIAGSQYAELPTAHLSNIEAPAEFTAALIRFLKA